MQAIYMLENLECANCAAKIEAKIARLPGVEKANLVFATKQLRLTAENPMALLPEIVRIAKALEPDVEVVPRGGEAHGGMETKTYALENLGCANCAAKIEARIGALEGVEAATVTFATKQLKVTAVQPDALLEEMQAICAAIEPDVRISLRQGRVQAEKGDHATSRHALAQIGIGAALFAVGQFWPGLPAQVASLLFVAAYVLLGWRIVLTAAKNMAKGHVFDENFLMSVATLGAFAIGEYPEAVGVMLFFRVGSYFEARAVEKSRGQIMEAVDLRPETVQLVREGAVETVDAAQVAVGDTVLVRPGDRIPLDGVVMEGESRIDTSPVTGEPVPVKAAQGDAVLSGCVNVSGALRIRVEKVLAESMVTRILDSVENAAASKPKIDRFITRFARVYTPVVVAVALLTAIVPPLVTGDWSYWIYTALTFLVISCPCALVLSVPLAFFSGIGAGSKRGILFKGGAALEALKNVKAVVLDKTGTLTKGTFTVQAVLPQGMEADALLRLCASCEANSTHPIAASIVQAARERGLGIERPAEAEEIAGKGVRAVLPEGEALCGNRALLAAFGVEAPEEANAYGTEVLAALDGRYVGRLQIADALKEDAAPSIAALKRMGVKAAMLTGDAQESAEAVAAIAGIDEVRAKLLPEQKLEALREIRAQSGGVLFVGDGINDAPVLAGADVGAAMGSGADAAIEAADVVFITSKVQAVPQAIAIARSASAIAWQNVAVALAVKFVVMALGLAGFASMWMAVFADTGVSMLCVLNAVRILYQKDAEETLAV